VPTVVDALTVTLGLDSSAFEKGQAQARESLKKTKNDAAIAAKDMEASGQKAAQFFSTIKTEALALSAVLLGGVGIEQAIKGTTQSLVSLNQQAVFIGENVDNISAFAMALKRSGGDADAATAALKKFAQAKNDAQRGLNPQFYQQMALIGGNGSETPIQAMELFENFISKNKGSAKGRADIEAYNRAIFGLDEKTLSALIQIGSASGLRSEMEKSRTIGVPTKEETDAAIRLNQAFVEMEQHFETIRRELTDETTPSLIRIFAWLNDMLQNLGKIALPGSTYTVPDMPDPTNGLTSPASATAEDPQGRDKKAYDYFLSQGWSPVQAAALAGGIRGESGFNPRDVGDNGQAVGIGQWHPDRVQNILNGTGIDVRTASYEDQLRAMQWELTHTEASAGNALKSANTPWSASRALVTQYERSKWQTLDTVQRYGYTNAYVNRFSGGGNDPSLNASSGAAFFRGNGSSVSSSTTVGTVNIYTQAMDAKGIAGGFSNALVAQANRGAN